jgi:hypothetical protein
MKLSLKNVDWSAALAALQKEKGGNPSFPDINSAQILALSALYIPDFDRAYGNLAHACRLEPLNPLQEFRKALLLARVGQIERSAAILCR